MSVSKLDTGKDVEKVEDKTTSVHTIRPRGTEAARVVTVIETEAVAGYGTPGDPGYMLKQYWSLDGELLADSNLTPKFIPFASEEEKRQNGIT